MELRRHLTSKNIVILLVCLTLVILTAGYFLLSKPPRVAMEKYSPSSALAFLEIDSLTDVLDGLTNTKAWKEIAPVLGVSSQLKQLGTGLDLASRTGLGPDEAVIAGRAQYAVVVTGVEANAEGGDEGVSLRLKPRFTLIAETHSSASKAERLVNERISIIAARIFGEAMREESKVYEGDRLAIFRGPGDDRQLVAASRGSVVLIGNHEAAVEACLDAIANRISTLEQDEILKLRRKEMGPDPAIFAYITQTGIEKFAQLAPALLATSVTTDPNRISAIAGLIGHLSKQVSEGFFYGLEFDGEGVRERYLTVMRPEMAAGFKEALKPAANSSLESLRLVPDNALESTFLTIESVGAIPERTLKNLSSSLDIVATLALREFVINLRGQFGLEGGDSLERAVGNEMAILRSGEEEPTVMLIRVKDRSVIAPILNRYLTTGGAKVSSTTYNGTEVSVSASEDRRAAAYVGDFLVLGIPEQIEKIVDAQANNRTAANDTKVKQALESLPRNSPILAFEADEMGAAEMMLAISKLTRVTDGSPELLETEAMKKVLGKIPRTTSYTQFLEFGIHSESHSAVGIFKRLVGWIE